MGYLRRVPWGYGGAKAFRLCQTRVGKQTNLVFQMTLHPGRRDTTFWVSWSLARGDSDKTEKTRRIKT